MVSDFNQQVIDEFRANGGRVTGRFADARLLLLTTTGARSGARHTVPLRFLPDGGERFLVIGTAGGAPRIPDWYHNLVANPRVTVEDGVFTYDANAVVLAGADRDRVLARAAEPGSGWTDGSGRVAGVDTARAVPVVALEVIPGPPTPNAATWGAALRLTHNVLRRELGLIRAEIAQTGPGLGTQLRINCLTVCGTLHHHHNGEDAWTFPLVAERYPDLAHVVNRLIEEHRAFAALVEELEQAANAGDADRAQVLGRVERIIDELENHMRYEEEQLTEVLDALTPEPAQPG